ncbi:MAG: hypothetical protein ACOY0T_26995 [Myxococcota bacterium]
MLNAVVLTTTAFDACVDDVPPRDAPLPIEALRDLLGIVRALFAAWTRAKAGPIELEELAHIGRELRAALDLARKTEPGTLGHRAAWSRAEEATRLLGHLVGKLEPLHPVLEAAVQRALAPDAEHTAKTPALGERAARKIHERTRR